MGIVYAEVSLANPRQKSVLQMTTKALVDTGSLYLCIPEHLAIQLEFEELQKREITTADNKKHLCPYVGPIELKFANRACYVGAIVLGDEVLLGAVPMEDMDLVIHPALQKLIPNPDSPNIPSGKAKILEV